MAIFMGDSFCVSMKMKMVSNILTCITVDISLFQKSPAAKVIHIGNIILRSRITCQPRPR